MALLSPSGRSELNRDLLPSIGSNLMSTFRGGPPTVAFHITVPALDPTSPVRVETEGPSLLVMTPDQRLIAVSSHLSRKDADVVGSVWLNGSFHFSHMFSLVASSCMHAVLVIPCRSDFCKVTTRSVPILWSWAS